MKKKYAMAQEKNLPVPKEEKEPYRHQTLLKSNQLIGIKYKASVLENQLIYLGMLKEQNGQYDLQEDGLYVSLQASEIQKLTGRISPSSMYGKLQKIASEMRAISYGWMNEKEMSFDYTVLINRTRYENGVFFMRFANDVKKYLLNLQSYTQLPESIVMRFQKPYSFRLYETLKSQCYYPSRYKLEKRYIFEYEISIAELKLIVGAVDVNQPQVKSALSRATGKDEDYERALELSSENMFKRWSSFDDRCLRPSVNEINEISDIVVEYKAVRQGRGGKVKRVIFYLYVKGTEAGDEAFARWTLDQVSEMQKNDPLPNQDLSPVTDNPEQSEEVSADVLDTVDEEPHQVNLLQYTVTKNTQELMAEFNLDYEDILTIAEIADYDFEKIQQAYDALKACETQIHDVLRWMISAIRKGYKANSKVAYKGQKQDAPKKNSFTDYEQRTYDYDALMEQLRKAGRA